MESNFKFLYYRILLISTILVSLIRSDEELIKNSKVLSCVSLARGAIKHEKVKIIIEIRNIFILLLQDSKILIPRKLVLKS